MFRCIFEGETDVRFHNPIVLFISAGDSAAKSDQTRMTGMRMSESAAASGSTLNSLHIDLPKTGRSGLAGRASPYGTNTDILL